MFEKENDNCIRSFDQIFLGIYILSEYELSNRPHVLYRIFHLSQSSWISPKLMVLKIRIERFRRIIWQFNDVIKLYQFRYLTT